MKIEQLERFCELMLSARFERFYKEFISSGRYMGREQHFRMGVLGIYTPLNADPKEVIIKATNLERVNALSDLMLSARFEEFYNEFVEGGEYSERDIPFQMAVDKMFNPIMEIKLNCFPDD